MVWRVAGFVPGGPLVGHFGNYHIVAVENRDTGVSASGAQFEADFPASENYIELADNTHMTIALSGKVETGTFTELEQLEDSQYTFYVFNGDDGSGYLFGFDRGQLKLVGGPGGILTFTFVQ